MVVDNLDAKCVAFAKLEADPPAVVDGHRPLVLTIALQLVQPDASKRTEVLQRLRDVQRQQQIGRGFEIQPAELMALMYYVNR